MPTIGYLVVILYCYLKEDMSLATNFEKIFEIFQTVPGF